ncbi:MAG: methylenetetrahydrofolate reductase, partial [Paracoccaceae bacterium]
MTGPAQDQDIEVSFELFPPKTERGMKNLESTVDRLAGAGPSYFSVTYGAGGSTRERTRKVVEMVAARSGLP